MNKLMTVVAASVCAVSLSGSAVAAEDQAVEADKEAAEAEEEESPMFEAGFDLDYFSAYVWRNAIQNDRQVIQPCVWADFTGLDPFWFGFSIWQNYDLTSRRRDVLKNALTETDYNLHVGATVWSNDAEDESDEMSLDLEFGHEWFVNENVRKTDADARLSYADTRELYLKATFNNPFVGVYGQTSWMYDDFGYAESGFHYELGLTKEVELVEDVLTLGADWNVSFGDRNYLSYLFGDVHVREAGEDGEAVGHRPYGFGGTTVKAYLNWAITDWMTLGGTIAYTGVLNGPVRDQLDEDGGYHRDYVWGGVSLKCAF